MTDAELLQALHDAGFRDEPLVIMASLCDAFYGPESFTENDPRLRLLYAAFRKRIEYMRKEALKLSEIIAYTQLRTVQPGDTWASLAKKLRGDETFWTIIRDANPNAVFGPNGFLAVGQTLVIPPIDESLRGLPHAIPGTESTTLSFAATTVPAGEQTEPAPLPQMRQIDLLISGLWGVNAVAESMLNQLREVDGADAPLVEALRYVIRAVDALTPVLERYQ